MFECVEGAEAINKYRQVRRLPVRNHYFVASTDFSGYSRARGLRGRSIPGTDIALEGYEDFVRKINGDNLTQVINGEIANNSVVPILDVCSGRARFLRECMQVPGWSTKLQPAGIDIHDWTRDYDPSDVYNNTYEDEFKGIEIITVDAQDLGEHFQGRSFRLITAMLALYYFADPLSPLQDIHNLLEVGGKGYIYNCPIPIADEDERKWFMGFLNDNGMRCEDTQLGIKAGLDIYMERKNPNSIQFPLKYDSWTNSGWEMSERFMYRVDKSIATE
jgi:hypothetical protein